MTNKLLSAFTDTTLPDTGYVGFTNISQTPEGDVVITVRNRGDEVVTASHTMTKADAIQLLAEALVILETE